MHKERNFKDVPQSLIKEWGKGNLSFNSSLFLGSLIPSVCSRQKVLFIKRRIWSMMLNTKQGLNTSHSMYTQEAPGLPESLLGASKDWGLTESFKKLGSEE